MQRSRLAVTQYVQDGELSDRFDDFEVWNVDSDGVGVTVTLRAVVPLPFIGPAAPWPSPTIRRPQERVRVGGGIVAGP